jgi:two-component system invasion response regulator UvrY
MGQITSGFRNAFPNPLRPPKSVQHRAPFAPGPSSRFLIGGPKPIIRYGLQILIREQFQAEVSEVTTEADALAALAGETWNVFAMDLMLASSGNWADLLVQALRLQPELAVLVLAPEPDLSIARESLSKGARAFASKQASVAELKFALEALLRNDQYVTTEVLRAAGTDFGVDRDTRLPHERLSGRELFVMLGLVSGKTVAALSADLAVSPKTVSTYRQRALSKLDLTNNAGLVRYAVHHGLV